MGCTTNKKSAKSINIWNKEIRIKIHFCDVEYLNDLLKQIENEIVDIENLREVLSSSWDEVLSSVGADLLSDPKLENVYEGIVLVILKENIYSDKFIQSLKIDLLSNNPISINFENLNTKSKCVIDILNSFILKLQHNEENIRENLLNLEKIHLDLYEKDIPNIDDILNKLLEGESILKYFSKLLNEIEKDTEEILGRVKSDFLEKINSKIQLFRKDDFTPQQMFKVIYEKKLLKQNGTLVKAKTYRKFTNNTNNKTSNFSSNKNRKKSKIVQVQKVKTFYEGNKIKVESEVDSDNFDEFEPEEDQYEALVNELENKKNELEMYNKMNNQIVTNIKQMEGEEKIFNKNYLPIYVLKYIPFDLSIDKIVFFKILNDVTVKKIFSIISITQLNCIVFSDDKSVYILYLNSINNVKSYFFDISIKNLLYVNDCETIFAVSENRIFKILINIDTKYSLIYETEEKIRKIAFCSNTKSFFVLYENRIDKLKDNNALEFLNLPYDDTLQNIIVIEETIFSSNLSNNMDTKKKDFITPVIEFNNLTKKNKSTFKIKSHNKSIVMIISKHVKLLFFSLKEHPNKDEIIFKSDLTKILETSMNYNCIDSLINYKEDNYFIVLLVESESKDKTNSSLVILNCDIIFDGECEIQLKLSKIVDLDNYTIGVNCFFNRSFILTINKDKGFCVVDLNKNNNNKINKIYGEKKYSMTCFYGVGINVFLVSEGDIEFWSSKI